MQESIIIKLQAAGCVFAEEEARLLISAAQTQSELAAMIDQRIVGLPLEHIIGWVEFCGVRIEVDPGVFVPRRRTEFLVSEAIFLAQTGSIVVDLCCGSGALGVAIASTLGQIELHAVDIDPVAVECARRNIANIGGYVYHGDLYDPLPDTLRGHIDILIANVPYVPTDRINLLPSEARLYEASVALDGGEDGLEVLSRVAADAANWLAIGGHLLVEISEQQANKAVDHFAQSGLISQVVRNDELDAIVIIGTRA
ncbi:putative protein N(5)-glutamine methyltransferase [Paenibacillus sp. N1-5-1-14]|uniref:putative protein N(5)-glutamine methyltransferase n=1 Tax=Paenibacillus radicibacter TaxID=2972488 RepID=UPI00215974AE|nr:putative protein N(5)-glutamine methyltransferase [Paenibacillus radicibacter]MCR8645482.1 putative protein N(5)-glutamine methyltransferase [Paenibacillus radicibacter]